jgi:protein-tyrosine phosphatase
MNGINSAYWVLPEKLMAGPYPASPMLADQTRAQLSWLVEQGISELIDLTNPGERPGYQAEFKSVCARYGVQGNWQRFAIADFGLPSPALMSGILYQIEHLLANDKMVYLHCMGGLGRTGTVVGCYYVQQGMSGEEALHKIQNLRIGTANFQHPSPETDAQQAFILKWGKS